MIVSSIVSVLDGAVSTAWSMVLNPAVLVVTDWEKEAGSFFPRLMSPMVAGLANSNKKLQRTRSGQNRRHNQYTLVCR